MWSPRKEKSTQEAQENKITSIFEQDSGSATHLSKAGVKGIAE